MGEAYERLEPVSRAKRRLFGSRPVPTGSYPRRMRRRREAHASRCQGIDGSSASLGMTLLGLASVLGANVDRLEGATGALDELLDLELGIGEE